MFRLARSAGTFDFILEQFDVQCDGAEWIADFVRNLRSEASDRRKPFRLYQPFLHGAEIGAILEYMYVPLIHSVIHTLQGHIYDFSFVVTGDDQD